MNFYILSGSPCWAASAPRWDERCTDVLVLTVSSWDLALLTDFGMKQLVCYSDVWDETWVVMALEFFMSKKKTQDAVIKQAGLAMNFMQDDWKSCLV